MSKDIKEFGLFLNSFIYKNGIAKGMSEKRYGKLDKFLHNYITECNVSVKKMLDIGVCSGITTMELSSFFEDKIEIVGTDLTFYVYKFKLYPFEFYFDKNKRLMKLVFFRIAFHNHLGLKNSLIKIPMFVLNIAEILLKFFYRTPQNGEKISLIYPGAYKDNISYLEDDITITNTSFLDKFNLVRIADVFTDKFRFTDPIRKIILSYMKDESYLFIIDKIEGGILFKKSNQKLVHIDCFGTINSSNGTVYSDLKKDSIINE